MKTSFFWCLHSVTCCVVVFINWSEVINFSSWLTELGKCPVSHAEAHIISVNKLNVIHHLYYPWLVLLWGTETWAVSQIKKPQCVSSRPAAVAEPVWQDFSAWLFIWIKTRQLSVDVLPALCPFVAQYPPRPLVAPPRPPSRTNTQKFQSSFTALSCASSWTRWRHRLQFAWSRLRVIYCRNKSFFFSKELFISPIIAKTNNEWGE